MRLFFTQILCLVLLLSAYLYDTHELKAQDYTTTFGTAKQQFLAPYDNAYKQNMPLEVVLAYVDSLWQTCVALQEEKEARASKTTSIGGSTDIDINPEELEEIVEEHLIWTNTFALMHTIGDDTTFLNFLPTYKNSSYRFSTASQAVNIDATPSLLRENNQNYREGVLEDIVIISEEIAIDCVWIKLTDYYALWDSERINPYNIDASNFNDTIALTLYDEKQNLNWAMPLDTGIINSHFGIRNYRWHHGTDLDLNSGDPVRATFDGVVRVAKYGRGYGYHVVIRHYNGLETLYGHLRKLYVKPGTYVRAGQQLGEGGSTGRSTGPHLHFEVRYEGNAIDPALLFDFEQQTIKEQVFSLTPQHFSHLSQARQSAYHSVRSGDSLWKISRRYGTSIQALCKLNGISSKTSLRVGMRLRVR